MLVAAPFAPLLSRYRGIFFAMLTLALSMVTYGLLMKLDVLGGSDGFNVGRPTLLGQKLPDDRVGYILYLLTIFVATIAALAMRIFFDSTRGLVTLAVRENELRVEYLGGSVRRAMAINFVVAAFCGGLGGALVVLSLGHIEPNFSFWTTSGEFVFVAILAGWQSVAAVFVASTVLEVVRSFSSAYFPEHLAARARPVPAVRDPLPAARHRLALDQRGRAMSGATGGAPLLHAQGVDKRFGAVVAAAAITIAIAAGEHVSLIGSNGAGKTTFVNMITGYLKPDAGRISFDGRDITPLAAARDHAPRRRPLVPDPAALRRPDGARQHARRQRLP